MKTTILFMAAAGCVATLMAQPPEPPAVLQILHETIKEGKAAAHTKTEQVEASVFRKNKFPFHYLGLSSISGSNDAVFVSAYPSFAAFDNLGAESGGDSIGTDSWDLGLPFFFCRTLYFGIAGTTINGATSTNGYYAF